MMDSYFSANNAPTKADILEKEINEYVEDWDEEFQIYLKDDGMDYGKRHSVFLETVDIHSASVQTAISRLIEHLKNMGWKDVEAELRDDTLSFIDKICNFFDGHWYHKKLYITVTRPAPPTNE